MGLLLRKGRLGSRETSLLPLRREKCHRIYTGEALSPTMKDGQPSKIYDPTYGGRGKTPLHDSEVYWLHSALSKRRKRVRLPSGSPRDCKGRKADCTRIVLWGWDYKYRLHQDR